MPWHCHKTCHGMPWHCHKTCHGTSWHCHKTCHDICHGACPKHVRHCRGGGAAYSLAVMISQSMYTLATYFDNDLPRASCFSSSKCTRDHQDVTITTGRLIARAGRQKEVPRGRCKHTRLELPGRQHLESVQRCSVGLLEVPGSPQQQRALGNPS